MDLKKIEKQLLDFAENFGGEELVEELTMETKTTDPTLKQSESKTTLFDPDRFRLDSELIRVRIKECNLTLKQLHEKVGVSYRTVMRWLTDEKMPKDKKVDALVKYQNALIKLKSS